MVINIKILTVSVLKHLEQHAYFIDVKCKMGLPVREKQFVFTKINVYFLYDSGNPLALPREMKNYNHKKSAEMFL